MSGNLTYFLEGNLEIILYKLRKQTPEKKGFSQSHMANLRQGTKKDDMNTCVAWCSGTTMRMHKVKNK